MTTTEEALRAAVEALTDAQRTQHEAEWTVTAAYRHFVSEPLDDKRFKTLMQAIESYKAASKTTKQRTDEVHTLRLKLDDEQRNTP